MIAANTAVTSLFMTPMEIKGVEHPSRELHLPTYDSLMGNSADQKFRLLRNNFGSCCVQRSTTSSVGTAEARRTKSYTTTLKTLSSMKWRWVRCCGKTPGISCWPAQSKALSPNLYRLTFVFNYTSGVVG